jgi:hypothetical protein
MPRNYDEMRDAEDRSFIIRGETFTLRRLKPEAMGRITEIEEKFANATTFEEVTAINEERLMLFIDDANGAADRWAALRAKEDDPITYGEITDLSQWVVSQVTGLPTMPPSPSEAGRGKTAASSKAG